MATSWRQAVIDGLKIYAEEHDTNLIPRSTFLEEQLDHVVQMVGSVGVTPAHTACRVLQELRSDGLLAFVGTGEYQILSPLTAEIGVANAAVALQRWHEFSREDVHDLLAPTAPFTPQRGHRKVAGRLPEQECFVLFMEILDRVDDARGAVHQRVEEILKLPGILYVFL